MQSVAGQTVLALQQYFATELGDKSFCIVMVHLLHTPLDHIPPTFLSLRCLAVHASSVVIRPCYVVAGAGEGIVLPNLIIVVGTRKLDNAYHCVHYS